MRSSNGNKGREVQHLIMPATTIAVKALKK
jgi:hypothetical protein